MLDFERFIWLRAGEHQLADFLNLRDDADDGTMAARLMSVQPTLDTVLNAPNGHVRVRFLTSNLGLFFLQRNVPSR